MQSTNEQLLPPSIGVAAVVWKEGKILLGHDLGKDSKPIFGVPGGHWESGETLVQAIRREIAEESAVQVRALRLVSVYEFFREDKKKSYVTIGFEATWEAGEPANESETTRKNWGWYEPQSLPSPLFAPDAVLIERCLSGVLYPGEIETLILNRRL